MFDKNAKAAMPHLGKWMSDECPYVLDQYLEQTYGDEAIYNVQAVVQEGRDNSRLYNWLDEHRPDELMMYEMLKAKGDV
jgi:hypothetical protein